MSNKTPVERFHEKVVANWTTGCWEWKASRNHWGYGHFRADGLCWQAHRWSYTHYIGPIPEGMFVCHRCDNPRCVNPNHLFLGTPADNTYDMETKKRSRHPRLDAHGRAKLTLEKAQEIRRRYAAGEVTMLTLAVEYGVPKQTIWKVIHNLQWVSPPKVQIYSASN